MQWYSCHYVAFPGKNSHSFELAKNIGISCFYISYKRLPFLQVLGHAIFEFLRRMCKGIVLEEGNLPIPQGVVSTEATSTGSVSCELCDSKASLYCQADDAFLCRKCDKRVHGANFLALRHIRCFLCNTCQNLTQRYLIGASAEVVLPTIVSWSERSQCNSNTEKMCSRKLKMPFLFL